MCRNVPGHPKDSLHHGSTYLRFRGFSDLVLNIGSWRCPNYWMHEANSTSEIVVINGGRAMCWSCMFCYHLHCVIFFLWLAWRYAIQQSSCVTMHSMVSHCTSGLDYQRHALLSVPASHLPIISEALARFTVALNQRHRNVHVNEWPSAIWCREIKCNYFTGSSHAQVQLPTQWLYLCTP
jgi:hypothetical protein